MILATHGFLASSGAFIVPPLLDNYPNAAAAYSLRLLRTTYTGSAIRVRRASDNTEQNIGFTAFGGLDTSSLTSFCSGTNGFVTTWYDQSGNGYNATQTTAANQPQIVSSGSVILENGKPSVQFDGVNDCLISLLPILTSDLTSVAIIKNTVVTNSPYLANFGDSSFGSTLGNVNSVMRIQNTSSSNAIYSQSIITNAQSLQLLTKNSTTWNWYENSISRGSKILGGDMNLKTIAGRLGGTGQVFFNGFIQEIILYNSNQSSNRTGIETNINSFYSIY